MMVNLRPGGKYTHLQHRLILSLIKQPGVLSLWFLSLQGQLHSADQPQLWFV